MDIKLLKSDILSNNIPNFLIFVEHEPALARQYIDYISDTVSKPVKFYDSIENVIYDITTGLKDDSLYVVRDEKLKKNENVLYISNLIDVSKGRNVIVRFDNVDKQTSDFQKKFSNYIVTFPKLDKYTLLAYCNKMCKENACEVEQDKLEQLIEYCDCNLGVLMNELNKIFTLGQVNSNILFDYMMKNGFSDYRNIDTVDFVNRILNRDIKVFDDVSKISDGVVSIAYILYNTARARLIATKNSYFAKIMKLSSYVYDGVIDGTMANGYALKYLLMKVFE